MRRIILPRPPASPFPRVQDSPVFSAAGSVWALLFGMGMLLLGNGLQGSLLGVRAAEESFGSTVTGVVMSGYFVGFLIGSRLAPYTIRRVGHLRVFAAIGSLASIAILIQSAWITPTVWALMRVVTGYCLASAYIVAESWLNDRVTNEHRGGLLAVYMIVSYLGMGGGQLLLNTGTPSDSGLFILVSILISFAVIPILLSITPQPVQDQSESLGVIALYRISPLGLVGSFGSGILQGAVFGMGAVYARSAGLSVAQVSIFMFVLVAGAALFQWPIGKLSDRMDRRKVIAGLSGFGAIVSVAAVIATYGGPELLIALSLLIGAGPMLLYSLFIAYTNDHLRPEQMVAASSTLILIFGSGAILGPSSAGALMDVVGPTGFLWVLALGQAGITGFALYRMTRTETGPVEEQSPYSANPARTAALSPALAEWVLEQEQDGTTRTGPEVASGADHPSDRGPDAVPDSTQPHAGGLPEEPPLDQPRKTEDDMRP